MTERKNYFDAAAGDYRKYRPQYPEVFFDYLAKLAPARLHALDCGCGNGQASVALAQRFQHVTARDVSAEQIAQAERHRNIRYQVGPAEVLPVEDESLDLVTVAQAIHWFDHPRFFAAVDRSLKPGGLLAVWGYQLLHTDTLVDQVVNHFHRQVLGPYWPSGRSLLDEGYTAIQFPYPHEATPPFFMEQAWNFQHLLGYLNTWSAVKRFQELRGFNPLTAHEGELRRAWGDEERTLRVYWPLILYLGRKARASS